MTAPLALGLGAAAAASDVGELLRRDRDNANSNYNEMILDSAAWLNNLPDSVEAVLATGPSGKDSEWVGAYDKFLRAYPHSRAPLLRYEPSRADPFVLVREPGAPGGWQTPHGTQPASSAWGGAGRVAPSGGEAAAAEPGRTGDVSKLGYG